MAAITLENSISALKKAADEIPHDDFISFSTILDAHLSFAHDDLSPEDQAELLTTVFDILRANESLFRDISWDLVTVLLPFLESSHTETADTASAIIKAASETGNPREVFIKLVEAISTLHWNPENEDEDTDDDPAYQSGDEESAEGPVPNADRLRRKVAALYALKKYYILLLALSTVHPRINARYPSRFLSTSLTTLLRAFAKASEVLECDQMSMMVASVMRFVNLVKPSHFGRRTKVEDGERPPLPPRTSTSDTLLGTKDLGKKRNEDDENDEKLQVRLLVSFLTHLLENYLIHTKNGDGETGIEIGWADRFDRDVVRKGRAEVPGGKTLIAKEREERESQTDAKDLVDEITALCAELGLETEELLTICQEVDDGTKTPPPSPPSGPPSTVSSIPLSPAGSLFLLSQRLLVHSPPPLSIFPTHSSISQHFLLYNPSSPPTLDAVLFLGALALHTGGLGELSHDHESFLLYLQIFAAQAATNPSATARWLSLQHVKGCLSKHPIEGVRISWVRDTLEHCPFETLKAASISVVKEEILRAITPAPVELGESAPNTPSSVWGSRAGLEEVFELVFFDVEAVFQDAEAPEEELKTIWGTYFPRISAVLNLYYFLLKSEAARARLGVCEKKSVDRVEGRFLGPVKNVLARLGGGKGKGKETAGEGKEGEAGMEVEVVRDLVERVEEVRGAVVD